MIRAAIAFLLSAGFAIAKPHIVSVTAEVLMVGGVTTDLPVRVTVVGAGDVPPVVGEVLAKGDTLRFVPTFPFSERTEYLLEVGELSERFKVATSVDLGAAAEVVAVYPSSDVLPQNQLKFYIHFSRPMSRGEAYERVRLRDAEGEVVADPFLELADELWDAEGKRLTLFLDPGRVKRGLKPHREVGPPLEVGKRYRLEIAAAWKDAERRPMAKPFVKPFRATAPDYRQPEPGRWVLSSPPGGTREPLVVRFPAALDHALLSRLLEVRNGGSKDALAGVTEVADNETCWAFTPSKTWGAGGFRVFVGSELEDLAGNSIRSPFEVTAENPGLDFVGPTVSDSFRCLHALNIRVANPVPLP